MHSHVCIVFLYFYFLYSFVLNPAYMLPYFSKRVRVRARVFVCVCVCV